MVDLSPREFALLEFLMRNAGRSVVRSRIAEAVWNYQFDPETNVVDVYVNYLRKKLSFAAARFRSRRSGAWATARAGSRSVNELRLGTVLTRRFTASPGRARGVRAAGGDGVRGDR